MRLRKMGILIPGLTAQGRLREGSSALDVILNEVKDRLELARCDPSVAALPQDD